MSASYLLGLYNITLSRKSSNWNIASISVRLQSDINRVIWSTNTPFLRISNSTIPQPPILNGNYQFIEFDHANEWTQTQTIDSVELHSKFNKSTLTFYGDLKGSHADSESTILDFKYQFQFQTFDNITDSLLHFALNLFALTPTMRVHLSYDSDFDERFYGFGESFTYVDLTGRVVPILVSEQGVGRGVQPLTNYFNKNISEGAGGYWYTTYAPRPAYITNKNRALLLDNSCITVFNLTATSSNSNKLNSKFSNPKNGQVSIEILSNTMQGQIMYGSDWLHLIEIITSQTGRAPNILPQWTQIGAVVGLEGGTDNVTKIFNRLIEVDVPIAGVWLQDWVGMRHSWDGDRLIWNWELNKDWYPGWDGMIDSLSKHNTRVLTYISPFFSDPTNFSTPRRNFYQEGLQNGYFVQRRGPHGVGTEAYTMQSLSIQFCMLDFSNPSAVRWMKNILIEQVIAESGSSGWMADFGEYLPFDAILDSGESAADYHNKYPEMWAKLSREAIEEVQRQDDVVFFMRSAWTKSPEYVSLYWLGDQLESWDGYDGLQSAVTGALSGGLSGLAITHSDIGGYNSITSSSMYFARTPELLKRWTEFAAFGSGLFRTHIGSTTSTANAQIYDSKESTDHFCKFAKIFSNLSSYRTLLMVNATKYGHPLMRPMVMHYPTDPDLWRMFSDVRKQSSQYMFGPDILVAPTMTQGCNNATVYFPRNSGSWIHLWSGKIIISSSNITGLQATIQAPIGYPFVAYQKDSLWGIQLRAFVLEKNYTLGYSWVAFSSGSTSYNHLSSYNSTLQNETVYSERHETSNEVLIHVIGVVLPVVIVCLLVYIWLGCPVMSSRSRSQRYAPLSSQDFANESAPYHGDDNIDTTNSNSAQSISYSILSQLSNGTQSQEKMSKKSSSNKSGAEAYEDSGSWGGVTGDDIRPGSPMTGAAPTSWDYNRSMTINSNISPEDTKSSEPEPSLEPSVSPIYNYDDILSLTNHP